VSAFAQLTDVPSHTSGGSYVPIADIWIALMHKVRVIAGMKSWMKFVI